MLGMSGAPPRADSLSSFFTEVSRKENGRFTEANILMFEHRAFGGPGPLNLYRRCGGAAVASLRRGRGVAAHIGFILRPFWAHVGRIKMPQKQAAVAML